MTESEALARMVPPAGERPNKPYRGGVIQVLVTSSCDKQCYGCTQASQLRRKPWFMTPEQYEQALESLRGYWGVVGLFGGNPAIHPQFDVLCEILRESWVPLEQRGIWSNNPLTVQNAIWMRNTFNPKYSNLNCHLDAKAYEMFKQGWPEANVVGLFADSRHSPPFVAMRDVLKKDCPTCKARQRIRFFRNPGPCPTCGSKHGTVGQVYDEERAWELIAGCDINMRWSAGIGVFRGQLRAWFCEVAMAQAILHQDEPDYPDTGLDPTKHYSQDVGDPPPYLRWWQLPMVEFAGQVRKHCHECSIPLRGFGELSQAEVGTEQTSRTYAAIFHPKRKDRPIQVVTELEQLGVGRLREVTRYIQNGGIR